MKRVEKPELMSAYFQLRGEIMAAYVFLREKNMSIPSETLDFIKDAAFEKLERMLEDGSPV
jgi:hypothetical protein